MTFSSNHPTSTHPGAAVAMERWGDDKSCSLEAWNRAAPA
jgi:hypothetical protein